MSINELKKLSPRELNKFMSKITAKEVKEILNNENLGGGLSKYNKDTLVDILLDLIYETNDSGLMDTLKPKKVRKNKKKVEIEGSKKKTRVKEDVFLEDISKIAKDIVGSLTIDPEQYYEEYLEYDNEESSLEAYGETVENILRIPFFDSKTFDILSDKVEEITGKDLIDYVFEEDVNKVIKEETFKIGKVVYKQLVKYFHPDKTTGDTEKFKRIQEDWERFKNKNKTNIN